MIDKIKKIIDAVNIEQNSWREIIKTYNARFYMFHLKYLLVMNLDVILKNEVPFIKFTHVDRDWK